MGHLANRCYLKVKDVRVNQMTVKNGQERSNEITCFNCQGRGHMARQCRKPKKRLDGMGFGKDRTVESKHSGNECRPSESSSRPTVRPIQ
jgi:hypothetical protein